MVLEHGEHVVVTRDDPEAERGREEDGLLATRQREHVERVLALLRRRRVERDRGARAHRVTPPATSERSDDGVDERRPHGRPRIDRHEVVPRDLDEAAVVPGRRASPRSRARGRQARGRRRRRARAPAAGRGAAARRDRPCGRRPEPRPVSRRAAPPRRRPRARPRRRPRGRRLRRARRPRRPRSRPPATARDAPPAECPIATAVSNDASRTRALVTSSSIGRYAPGPRRRYSTFAVGQPRFRERHGERGRVPTREPAPPEAAVEHEDERAASRDIRAAQVDHLIAVVAVGDRLRRHRPRTAHSLSSSKKRPSCSSAVIVASASSSTVEGATTAKSCSRFRSDASWRSRSSANVATQSAEHQDVEAAHERAPRGRIDAAVRDHAGDDDGRDTAPAELVLEAGAQEGVVARLLDDELRRLRARGCRRVLQPHESGTNWSGGRPSACGRRKRAGRSWWVGGSAFVLFVQTTGRPRPRAASTTGAMRGATSAQGVTSNPNPAKYAVGVAEVVLDVDDEQRRPPSVELDRRRVSVRHRRRTR